MSRNQARPCKVAISAFPGAFLLVGLFLSSFAAGEAQEKLPDPWAGKPILDAVHVTGLVEGRLHNAPKLGEQAPAVTLPNAITGAMTTVPGVLNRKPVVLYFASYSCTVVQESADQMSKLSRRFADSAEFVLIYIREAHPAGGFPPPFRGDRFVIPARLHFTDRAVASIDLARRLGGRFTVLVDTMDDANAVRWGAWPLRVFVVETSGEVVYSGQQGPWFFKPTPEANPGLVGVPRLQHGKSRRISPETGEETTDFKISAFGFSSGYRAIVAQYLRNPGGFPSDTYVLANPVEIAF